MSGARDFASVSGAAWAHVVARRQAHEAARAHAYALLERDPCEGRCTCALREARAAADRAEHDAYADMRAADAAWADYCGAR